ncbi:transketolase C-terminal domain-containing protein [Cohaesibacter gelatinilyticus]|uniref:Transketolase n=1 Tax=Cohaesibacter gelatinilyticus TaxID=372072 RepID=A0A285PEH9_9HYPH|nr:transketolase C-terminal domain-containing protein [Cohaesibacter gelatinilyticus]SNZ20142.1 transketolase [Cohaesibacter gelatinilyticus]
MGDQIGQAVDGKLVYIPFAEFEKVRKAPWSREQRVAVFADMCRLNALYMIARAGSGHIGSSFSSMEIFSWMMLEELELGTIPTEGNDLFFSSKGHDAPGYYAVLMGMGRLEFDLVHKLRKIDGLPGHPDVHTPNIITNTGSLGMGISKAKGMIHANRLAERDARVVVLTGDGELQEGQFWESLVSATNHKLHELIVVIDHNKLQSDTFVKNVSDLGDLDAKLAAFGWRVERCDGNDVAVLAQTLADMKDDPYPKVIIADTVKGKGVSFMEHTSLDSDVDMYRFHSGAPDANSYQKAVGEITDRISAAIADLGGDDIAYDFIVREPAPALPETAQKLIPAYTEALLQQAGKHPNLVALDADLILDTGLIPFRETFPERFIECGIAEQDMVSMAGGLALGGALPIAHSFSCFLTSRPNEQIYNNATEKTKVIYVGSLAGVVPGGPGHSHQAVRDIASLSGIPDMVMVEPCCAAEVAPLLDWCVNEAKGSSYIRLTSIPCDIPFALPEDYEAVQGQGTVLVDGDTVAIVTHGPILTGNAVRAAEQLTEAGISTKVINMPWLNTVDGSWLAQALAGCTALLTLDNHYMDGGLSDAVGRALECDPVVGLKVSRLGVSDVPPSGTNSEVLDAVGLSVEHIAARATALAEVR